MTDSNVPILDLKPEIQELWPQLQAAMERVVLSGQFILGPEVHAFEQEAAAYLGVKHVVGLSSGTDALVISLRALGIGAGDEVITTPFTFVATAEAATLIGATPVLVDIEPRTFNMNPALVEESITKRTRAIIPVHLFGHAVDMDPIMSLARKHGLKVLEDTAQATGGKYKGTRLGGIGDAGAFSFFPTKNLGGFGDGGMISTNDDNVAQTAQMLRNHGSRARYLNEMVGYNARLDELQAALLRVKLPRLDRNNDQRREAAEYYTSRFSEISGLHTPVEAEYAHHVYHQYTLRIRGGKRDAVREQLTQQGISSMVYYPAPLHRLPVYSQMKDMILPHAEKAASEVLSLPIWPGMGREIQDRVINAVADALGQ